ncbi:DUF2905 family protein [Anaerospora hongkongensis]|uniref:DUF2905 family protein n=1 Tax=Anaerospora hongkongensis TaxID=244830 RepID=A0A4R1Q3I7_9FIRM|nr:DUF2905 domain-containing protein [Anaerospora hongkongensis]TCL35812.1 DUF2905 family protein [Anaerospora hongkongensis]
MPGFDSLGKILMAAGVLLLLIGAIVSFGEKFFSLGRLPGDIFVEKENVKFYFPIVTSLVISVILTIVLNVLFRR